MGWAWDLKKVNPATMEARMKSKGESKHYYYYKKSNTLYEWTTGVLGIAAPIVLVKWVLSRLFAAHYV